MLLDAIELALRQMIRNKARTFLTSLGILIGVAAVIAMVSVGQGAAAGIQEDLSAVGGRLVFVAPGSSRGFGATRGGADPFMEADVDALDEVPGVAAAAGAVTSPVVVVREELRLRTEARGATNAFLDVMAFEVAEGRRFEDGELAAGAGVCLLGASVADEMFPAGGAEGEELRLGEVSCRVVGVLAAKGENSFGMDQDGFVLLPLRFVQRRMVGRPDVNIVFLMVEEDASLPRVKLDIEALMDERRHIAPGAERDFSVADTAELTAMLDQVTLVLTSFLGAIAGVSLLVGGIGIMNIMLVSVTERTREIGIRLAVGARARDVLLQFLVEAVVLSALGGLAGVVLAIVLTVVIASLLEVPVVISPWVVGGALGVSALVGIVFGYWPARRAARMSPIDALRHE